MENYEQKYKSALGWMQSLYKGLHGATKEDAEHYFPELCESEDERIRKELIEFVKSRGGFKHEYLAWLEKQGEQKPTDKVEQMFVDKIKPKFLPGECIRYRGENYKIKDIEQTKDAFIYNVSVIGDPSDPEEVKTAIGFAAEQDMVKIEHTTWCEDDEKISKAIYESIDFLCLEHFGVSEDTLCDWLKSLKDRVQPQTKQEWSE